MDSTTYAPLLWAFTTLLIGRVLGQLVVALWAPLWLPPMDRWQSGLVPYWFLLSSQAVVIWLMWSISVDFTRGAGYWVEPRPWLGPAAYYWSYLYAGAMVVRAFVRRSHPIPIAFHTVVAAFQWTFGYFQMYRSI